MLRLIVYGNAGCPVMELSERLAEFHELEFLAIEREPVEIDSYFDDKIPEVTFDTGDFSSGSAQQHMVRNPAAMEIDKALSFIPDLAPGEFEGLGRDELKIIFEMKQGIIATEIPDNNLLRWATDVIYLFADEEDAVEWFAARLKCKSCGNVHHLKDKPSIHKGVCDRCGTDLVQMDCDKPEAIKEQYKNWRLDFFGFKEKAQKHCAFRYYDVNKFRTFTELVGRVDQWVEGKIEAVDNWYAQANDGVGINMLDGPYVWNPLTGKLDSKG